MYIVIFANAIHTNTLTGGDKIFVECAKRWIRWKHTVTIVTNEVGREYCIQNGIPSNHIIVWHNSKVDSFGVYAAMIVKTILSTLRALFFLYRDPDVVFASSFFFPDLIPAFILKLRYLRAKLVTASYLFTARKWGSDYSGGRIKGLLFYLNELASFYIMRIYGRAVLTASEYDAKRLITFQNIDRRNVLAFRGGVDNAFFSSVSAQKISYDAVFVGRFHPQKCLPELISIWKEIVQNDPKRVLALVGGGTLETGLKTLVKDNKLEHNVLFLGIQDGVEKAKILKSSRIFVSASTYDSGNIALDEALACGVPGIVYNLPRLDYPNGVIKVPVGDQKLFREAIQSLLSDEKKQKELGKAALSFAKTLDWDTKAKYLLKFICER